MKNTAEILADNSLLIKEIKELVKNTPNDMDLGEKIRALINKKD